MFSPWLSTVNIVGCITSKKWLCAQLDFQRHIWNNILVRMVACAVTETKCPLLMALFSLLSSLRPVTFLPEGVIVGLQKISWSFNSHKIRFGVREKNRGTPPALRFFSVSLEKTKSAYNCLKWRENWSDNFSIFLGVNNFGGNKNFVVNIFGWSKICWGSKIVGGVKFVGG